MPAGIVGAMVTYLEPILQGTYPSLSVWDGEIPRFNPTGQPIVLEPSILAVPAFRVVMTDRGLNRDWTMQDAYGDQGPLDFEAWTTTRAGTMAILNLVEATLVNSTNWNSIDITGSPVHDNPYQVYACLLTNWTCVMLEGFRTPGNNYIYYGRLEFDMGIHGAILTR